MDEDKKRKYNKVLAAISMLIFIRFMYGLVSTPEIGNHFKGCDNMEINSNRITNEEKNNINKFYENTPSLIIPGNDFDIKVINFDPLNQFQDTIIQIHYKKGIRYCFDEVKVKYNSCKDDVCKIASKKLKNFTFKYTSTSKYIDTRLKKEETFDTIKISDLINDYKQQYNNYYLDIELKFFYNDKSEKYTIDFNPKDTILLYDCFDELNRVIQEDSINKENLENLNDQFKWYFQAMVVNEEYEMYSNKLIELTDTLLNYKNKKDLLNEGLNLMDMYHYFENSSRYSNHETYNEITDEQRLQNSLGIQYSIENIYTDKSIKLSDYEKQLLLEFLERGNKYTKSYDSKQLRSYIKDAKKLSFSKILEKCRK